MPFRIVRLRCLATIPAGARHWPGDGVIVPASSSSRCRRSACLGGKTPGRRCHLGRLHLQCFLGEGPLSQLQIKAILAVNMLGDPARMAELKALGVPILEDCAHGFGVSSGGRPLGGRGDAGIISFYATELIGAGEGGAV